MAYHAGFNVPRAPHLVGGFLGVDMFFVLSGYLITTLLIGEWDLKHTVGLRNFYVRRALRLIPALILTIAFAAFVVQVVDAPFPRPFWQSALMTVSYVANWFQISEPLTPLGHTWSLSIEEQYYIVWPALVLIGLKVSGSKRRLGGIALALAVAMAVARYLTYDSGHAATAALSTFTRPDGLLIGSALALLLADPFRGMYDFFRRRDVALLSMTVIVAAMATFKWAQPEQYQGGLFFVNIATAVLVGHLALTRMSFIRRAFSVQPLPAIGRISYGLYLFHVPVLYLVFGNPVRRSGIVAAGAMFALTFAIAGASYLLIEAPVLKLKKRFGSISELSQRDDESLARVT